MAVALYVIIVYTVLTNYFLNKYKYFLIAKSFLFLAQNYLLRKNATSRKIQFFNVFRDFLTMSSFKRLMIMAQKTAKVTLNATRQAISTTMEQNKQRAETQEQHRVSNKSSIQ